MTAGAGAGLVSSIVTCPLDVIKTRLQAQHLARDSQDYEGVRLTILRIWRQSGLRGFYRGLGPTLGGYLPTWGIYFTVYDLVKDRLGGIARESVHIVAAMTAGATGTVLTNPLWAQAVLPASASRYRNTPEAFLSIYRTEGLRAFYKGLLPSLIGVSHVAVQFPLYEKAKSWADRGQGGTGDHSSLSPGTILMCSAFSKMVASLATYPHEVLRTRLQIRRSPSSSTSPSSPAPPNGGRGSLAIRPTPSAPPPSVVTPIPLYSPLVTGSNPPLPFPNHSGSASPAALGQSGPTKTPWQPRPGGVIDTFLKIKRQDGWRGFYRGLSINLVRTVPNSAVTMLTYELIMRHLSSSS
ncbi:Mitochondrial NAD(+) transporter 1 [Saitozyma sp. JCM 24511]|nr:Mitochondrial NAD(+) transporter 1 [Saitozyma sp. JCM 24511]